jgi:hypothetical protein
VLIVIVVALMAFFHHSVGHYLDGGSCDAWRLGEADVQIIDWLTPFVRKLQQLKYGWLIPVAILFVLSFPPLFGNEIVMILVGVVWGLGIGFAIVSHHLLVC